MVYALKENLLNNIPMKHFLIQTLHFSRAERAGSIALLFICGLVYLAPAVLHWLQPERSTDFSQFRADVQLFREKMGVAPPSTRSEPAGDQG